MTTAAETQAPGPASGWRDRVAALRNIPPLFRMVWDSAPRAVGASLVLRLMAALLPLALLAVTRLIIDAVDIYRAHNVALPKMFWWWVALEFLLAGIGALLARSLDFCDTVLADKYTRYICTRTMKHACSLDLTRYEDPVFYDKLERARVQGTDRLGTIQDSGRMIQETITAASLAASIYLFSPWILAALILCMVPAFLGEAHFAFLRYSLNFQQTPARREMDYLRILGGSKEGAKEMKLFGLAPFLVGRYVTLSDRMHAENVHLGKRKLYAGALLILLSTAGYYGAYAYAVYQTVAGVLSLGTLTFLVGAIAGASTNIQAMFTSLSGIADQALFASDLLEFFSVRPTIQSKPGALRAPRPIRQGFEFKNVTFAYPGTLKPVLRNVNFRLDPGERLALVGENGEGKTTVVKLLTRLYEVTSGAILLDGVDLREYALEDLWKEIGVIFQDFMRYEMTAAENIAIGRIEERQNLLRIQGAAFKSLAEEVIDKLPKRYDQMLGCRFDGGVDLSGGEWQRMAIARAYLRDAQLLILDEPTASLDARSEHEVFERFAELTKGKMSLLISHRFSTVRMADRILVLENGRIAEQGPHDELLERGGRYAEMFELQAANYR